MKKIVAMLLMTGVMILMAPVIQAQEMTETPLSKTGEIVTVRQDTVINRDFYITAGETVEILGLVNGDIYAFGGQVLVNGIVNGDVIAAGGQVRIAGEVNQNVRVGGGQVTISGEVGRNVTMVGGNLDLAETASIGGGVLVAGGNANILSQISGDVFAAGGNVNLGGSIGKDVVAYVGNLRVGPGAQINGNLTYYSNEAANIDSSSQIDGEVKQEPIAGEINLRPEQTKAELAQVWQSIRWGFRVMGLISTGIVGLILVNLFPIWSQKVATKIMAKSGISIGIGLLILLITPIAAVLMIITLVGIPLGALALAGMVILGYIAQIAVDYWLGTRIAAQMGWKLRPGWIFLLGLGGMFLVGLVPILGPIIKMVAMLAGMGAIWLVKLDLYRAMRKEKVI